MRKEGFTMALAGAAAGVVNGLFGAGGGMILVPLLTRQRHLGQREVFPASICIILPMCLLTLAMEGSSLPWRDALPYLVGSGLGGVAAGLWGRKIPTIWLHRVLGALILWGGWRYLW